MIDGFRRGRRATSGLHPADRHHADKIVVGDHSGDRPAAGQHPAAQPFVPPVAIAAAEESHPDTATVNNFQPAKRPGKLRRIIDWFKRRTKKQWAIIIVIVVLLLAAGVAAFIAWHGGKPVKQANTPKPAAKIEPPKPTTVASVMTGVQVDPAVNERPVTGIMVENSELARPQSGLNQADIIFEAIAEGGITRFLLLFHDTVAPYVGPVRSVRPYYIQWGLSFDAAIAHVGGSPEALQDMKSWGVKDLDQFANGSYFHRVGSREAPHNVYTSIAEMNDLETKRGYGKANFTSLPRKAEDPSKTPGAKSINLTISSAAFNVHYDYDAATNSYKRSQAGAPHTVADQQGAQVQLQPKVVVALVVSQGIAADDLHTAYGTIGTGHAYIFQDGKVAEGNWKKDGNGGPLILTNLAGQPLLLNPGQTWFTAINATNRVTFTP